APRSGAQRTGQSRTGQARTRQARTRQARTVPPRAPAPRQRSLPDSAAISTRQRTRGRARRRIGNTFAILAALLVVALVATWSWVESSLTRVEALSGAPNTPGETYLIVGSDQREPWRDDGTEGARTDTILVLHKPESGPVALISIPRDSYAEI